jgi:tetratricopeptide (TPR) repeat protein
MRPMPRYRSGLAALLLSLPLIGGCDSADEKAETYLRRGLATLEAGELDKAAVDFRSALKLKENFAGALLGLAEVEERRRNFDAAARLYASVAARDPRHLESRISLARLLLAARQVDAASKYAEESGRLAPGDPRVLVLQAGIALSRGQRDEAVRLAGDALRIAPGDGTALMVLVSERVAASDPSGAMQLIERGLARNESDLGLQLLKLRTLEAMGEERRAEQLLVQLADLFPNSPALLEARIKWYLGKGRLEDAERAARQAALASPAEAAAQIRLAQLIGRTRGAEAAIGELQNIIAGFPAGDEAGRLALDAALAQLLAQARQWDMAIELSSAILAAESRNVDALTARAISRMATGMNAEAVEDLTAALAEAPGSASLTLLLAGAHERMGSAVLAEEQYSKALALSGYAPESGIRLARFLMRYGRAERAVEVLESLRTRGTADRASLSLLASLRKPGADGGQAAAADPVEAHLRAGRLAEAEKLARDRLNANPSDSDAHILLGSVLMAAGRNADAEAAFRSAASGGGARGELALARFFLRGGRLAEAEQAARTGLERRDSSALRLLLAEILEARGQHAEAIAEYETLMRSDPASTVVANNLASLLSERSDDPKALERAFAIAIRFHSSDVPQFLDTLGWIHYLRGEYYAALPLLKRAAEKLPESGTVQFHLGMVLREVGEHALSAAALERAVKLAPAADAHYLRTAAAALEQMKPAASAN